MALRRLCSTALGGVRQRGLDLACQAGWRSSTSASRLADTATSSSSTCSPPGASTGWLPCASRCSSSSSSSAAAAAAATPAASRHVGGCWGLTDLTTPAQLWQQRGRQQGMCLPQHTSRSLHTSSHQCSSSSSGSEGGSHDLQSIPAAEEPGRPAAVLGLEHLPSVTDDDIDTLMTALLQPMPSSPAWNGQLNHVLLGVGDQKVVEPRQVLISMLRALHVVRAVLQENGHIYVLGGNPTLRPILEAAARSCINSNVWFMRDRWRPGTLTNYASHQRLFKKGHQPNRAVLAARGLSLINPLCMEPHPLQLRPPRLGWEDKWTLYELKWRLPQAEQLLEQLIRTEDHLHKIKPQGSLRGEARHLALMVVLDSTRNTPALREAYQVNIPTIALVNPTRDLSNITYPVLARDFHPGFVHFFLDWLIKVVNVQPGEADALTAQAQS